MQVKQIGNYEVTFSRIDNRKRSLLRRRLAAMSASISSVESNLSDDEKQVQEIKDVAVMMNHDFYDEVRDLIFSLTTIKGDGNALTAFNAFGNCFEHDDELEMNIFKEGIEIYLGKPQGAENTDKDDSKNLIQL